MYLALQVFVAEMANLVMRLPLELMMLLHRLLTGRWSFLDYLVMIVLMSLLIGYFGTRYLLRQEYVLPPPFLFYGLSALLLPAP